MKWLDRFHHMKIRPWIIWGIAAFFTLYTFLLQGTPSVMIPQLMKTYQIDVIKIGVLTASFFYTYLMMQIPAGIFVDLWGPRRILKISFLVCSLAVGWFAFSDYFWEGQTTRMLMGLTTAPAIASAFCLASRWFKPALFTLLVALTEFLALLGGVIGEGGIAESVVVFGWRETMVLISVVGLILTFLTIVFVHDYPDHDEPLHNGKSLKQTIHDTKLNLKAIFSVRQIWMNGIFGGLVFGIIPSFAALWSVPYFSLRYDLSVDQAAWISSLFFVGACIGALAIGWISVHFPKRKPIMFVGSSVSLAAFLTLLLAPYIPLFAMYFLVATLGFFSSSYALCFPLASTYVTEKRKGVAMGFTNMLCILFGAPLLQPLVGFLLKMHAKATHEAGLENYTLEDYHFAFIPLPICLFFAFLLTFFVREKLTEKSH